MRNVFYFITLTCVAMIINSCSQHNNTIWRGEVSPGEYLGEYDFSMSGHTAHVKVQLSVFSDEGFELRETWCGGGCHEGTRAYCGALYLQEEVYNGEQKTWYTIHGINPNSEISAKYSLSDNLELKDNLHYTYQSFIEAKRRCILHKR